MWGAEKRAVEILVEGEDWGNPGRDGGTERETRVGK